MNEYIHKNYKKAARIQTVVCGFLFSIFSFIYLYVFQCDVLEALHFSLAHGKTHFAPLPSAIIITLILLLLRWGVNSLLGLKGEVRALSYFPSCLILGVLTDVGRTVYMSDYHTSWGWLLPLILLIYFLVTFWLRRVFRVQLNVESSPMTLMNSNLIILLVFIIMTILIGNSNRTFHRELEAEHYLRNHQYNEVLKIGQHSTEASRTLTVLRSIAMSHAGTLGEKLFEYPQYYKTDGLFFANDSSSVLRYTNDSIYYCWECVRITVKTAWSSCITFATKAQGNRLHSIIFYRLYFLKNDLTLLQLPLPISVNLMKNLPDTIKKLYLYIRTVTPIIRFRLQTVQ